MDTNAGEPVNPGGAPSNPLANLEDVVAAARQEAAAAQARTVPAQTPAETPQGQFVEQFGSGPATPPVAEPNPPDLMGQALADLGTPPSAQVPELKPEGQDNAPVAKLDPSIQVVENPNPTVEAVAPPEKTPADRLRQEIAASIDAFLEKVLQKQGVTS